MKLLDMILIFVCGAHIASCQQIEEMSYELVAEAVDEEGKPLEGIQVITGRLEAMGDGAAIILESAVGYQFFTAEAQKSQRNAEPCMWEDRKFGKTMELLGSPNG